MDKMLAFLQTNDRRDENAENFLHFFNWIKRILSYKKTLLDFKHGVKKQAIAQIFN